MVHSFALDSSDVHWLEEEHHDRLHELLSLFELKEVLGAEHREHLSVEVLTELDSIRLGSITYSQLIPETECLIKQVVPAVSAQMELKTGECAWSRRDGTVPKSPAFPEVKADQSVSPVEGASGPFEADFGLMKRRFDAISKYRKELFDWYRQKLMKSAYRVSLPNYLELRVGWVTFMGYTSTGKLILDHAVQARQPAMDGVTDSDQAHPFFQDGVFGRVEVSKPRDDASFRWLLCPMVQPNLDCTAPADVHAVQPSLPSSSSSSARVHPADGYDPDGFGKEQRFVQPFDAANPQSTVLKSLFGEDLSRVSILPSFGAAVVGVKVNHGRTMTADESPDNSAVSMQLLEQAMAGQSPSRRIAAAFYKYVAMFGVRGLRLDNLLKKIASPLPGMYTPVTVVGGAVRDMLAEPSELNDIDLSVSLPYTMIRDRLNRLFTKLGSDLNELSLLAKGKRSSWGMLKVEHTERHRSMIVGGNQLTEVLDKDGLDVGPMKAFQLEEITLGVVLPELQGHLRSFENNYGGLPSYLRAAIHRSELNTLIPELDPLEATSQYTFGYSFAKDHQYRDFTVNGVYIEPFSKCPILVNYGPRDKDDRFINKQLAAPTGLGDMASSYARLVNRDMLPYDRGAWFRIWKMTMKNYCPANRFTIQATCDQLDKWTAPYRALKNPEARATFVEHDEETGFFKGLQDIFVTMRKKLYKEQMKGKPVNRHDYRQQTQGTDCHTTQLIDTQTASNHSTHSSHSSKRGPHRCR